MSNEKEYIVVVNRGVDLTEFDQEMSSEYGASSAIPSRAIEVANARPGSKRMTHWMLSDDEAEQLLNDERVLSVEIPPDQRNDIQIGIKATQTSDFTKPSALDSDKVNWGLRRCIEATNIYSNGTTASNEYPYALDGTGVDVVIQDSGLQVDHPEFAGRVQQIDWYTESGLPGSQNVNHYRDFDGHGTHCAGIAAGKTYGWAKNANVYAQKLAGLEAPSDPNSGIPISDAFDAIRLWHAAKTNGRPTIVNMSWGYSASVGGSPTGGNYRGTGWTWGVDYTANLALWQATGIVIPISGANRIIPVRVPSVDAEIEDMIDAGIHVVIAAGNDYYKGDVIGGVDYDNTIVYGGSTYYYHRGSSPHSDEAIIVGNSDSVAEQSGADFLDKTSNSSSRGPRLTCYAPGTNIISTCSTTSIYATGDYTPDTNYKIALINGTSMAAPQVAGVIAQYLTVQPTLSPKNVKDKILNESKPTLFSTGSDSDYSEFGTSLLGAPNKFLYSKYGRQPYNISGGVTITK